MKIDDFVSVTGVPKLYKIVSAKNNGVLVHDIDEEKNKFFSARKHQFTPLGTISIYTLEDTVELSIVFDRIMEKKPNLPIPDPKADKMVLLEYFEEIVPDYDEDRVYLSDIKKVIKWFRYLDERNLLVASSEEE